MVQELICARDLGEHFLNGLAHEMALSLYLKVNAVKGDVSFTLIFAIFPIHQAEMSLNLARNFEATRFLHLSFRLCRGYKV